MLSRKARIVLQGGKVLLLAGAAALLPLAGADGKGFSVLYSFKADGIDGNGPVGPLLLGKRDKLYGATISGGNGAHGSYGGTVFEAGTKGGETVLANFSDTSGPYEPNGGVVGNEHDLYGSSAYGGAALEGTVYKVSEEGTTLLHSFCTKKNCADGSNPEGTLAWDGSRDLYGTAASGGKFNAAGGVVFTVTTGGHNYQVLHSFCAEANCADGQIPLGTILLAPDGNLYGTTYLGGDNNQGVVYEVESPVGTVIYKRLHSFTGADGANPSAGVIADSAGNLYGTTSSGGSGGAGTVYKIAADGTMTVLYNFTGQNDGGYPSAELVLDSAGNLYGTTSSGGSGGSGTLFEVPPQGGSQTVLHAFTGADDGGSPSGQLIAVQGTKALTLFGSAYGGGTYGAGTIFELKE